jgi:DNA-binding NtrC family response regulator/predicted hydrocarbon binding protein
MMSAAFFGELELKMAKTLGEEEARKVAFRAGYSEGFHQYVTVQQLFGRHEGFVVAPRLGEVQGLARIEVQSVCEDPSAFMVEIRFYNSVEAEQHLFLSGPSTTPVCCYEIGFASGYCTAERGMEIYFRELECVACGHSACSAIGRDAQSWGKELAQLREEYGFNSFADVEAFWAERRESASALIKHRRTLFSSTTHEATADRAIRKRTMNAIERGHFIVREPEMMEVLDQAVCVARLNSPVLVQGETGTGKEFVVNLIHQQSARADRELVSVNCAAFTESLLESELFGHTRGAFTGAVSDKPGLFELADEGTLFLDEVGEMPLGLQAKLLRAIENGEIRRVGSNKTVKVNPRFLAATNRDLQAMIATGKFREDLYFRLNSFVIQLPPLRERANSIPPMVQRFLQEVTSAFEKKVLGVSPEAMACLMAYAWPGNVRELKHAIERAVVVTSDQTIQVRDLPFEIRFCSPKKEEELVLKRGERQVIAKMLAEHQGDRTATARALNISISTLWRKMKRYDLMATEKTVYKDIARAGVAAPVESWNLSRKSRTVETAPKDPT